MGRLAYKGGVQDPPGNDLGGNGPALESADGCAGSAVRTADWSLAHLTDDEIRTPHLAGCAQLDPTQPSTRTLQIAHHHAGSFLLRLPSRTDMPTQPSATTTTTTTVTGTERRPQVPMPPTAACQGRCAPGFATASTCGARNHERVTEAECMAGWIAPFEETRPAPRRCTPRGLCAALGYPSVR